jgi:hypothetical protein
MHNTTTNTTTTTTTVNSGDTNAMNTTAVANAVTGVASVGSGTCVVGPTTATVCVSSVDDEDGTDAFMDELEDLIK